MNCVTTSLHDLPMICINDGLGGISIILVVYIKKITDVLVFYNILTHILYLIGL